MAYSADAEYWNHVIEGLRRGDDAASREFCQNFETSLGRLADRHLATGLRRRLDPEDVVQSVMRTFLRRAAGGQFQLEGSESLWRLLCAMTLTKVREQARFQLRQKRSPRREVAFETRVADAGARPGNAGGEPSPALAAEFGEHFERLLASFSTEEQQIVELKLQDLPNERIALTLDSSERTVRRLLLGIRRRLEASLAAG